MSGGPLFIGIDLGTCGCRACAIDAAGDSAASEAVALRSRDMQDPAGWWRTVRCALQALLAEIDRHRVTAIAVAGTSGTVLLTDEGGRPLVPPLMYCDARAVGEAATIAGVAPRASAARGPASSLAKLLWLQQRAARESARHLLHQADWIMGKLQGRFGASDENNCLKLGYDPVLCAWPSWLTELDVDARLLPTVYPPGTRIGALSREMAQELKLSTDVAVVTGTTDGVAGVIATGAMEVGEAVTSLGSTLVLKVIATEPVFAPEFGVYSHRLGDLWLAGGASNSGGAVLRQFFSQAELDAMTPRLQPDRATGLDYYPLPHRGERFPVCDPDLAPRLEPRPSDPVRFFQAILEGIAAIEQRGYEQLHALGAPYPSCVHTVGRGALNAAWTRIRTRRLGVEVAGAAHGDAAYGAALLAQEGAIGKQAPPA